MKKFIHFLLIGLLPMILHAQDGIKGKVLDEAGNALSLATIIITNDQDTAITLVSDGNGFFAAILPAGLYHLEARFVGYRIFRKDVEAPAGELRIALEREENMLEAVTVQANRPLVERKLDRIVFHVQNSIIASGGTVWEALSRTPGVRTGFDSEITANGKSVLVYMDNKPLRLPGEDLAAFLKGLNAENIQRIEVISNPPASFDAQGGAVINIISKKTLADGLNAMLSGAYARSAYGSYRGGIHFNYRSGKWNMYGHVNSSNVKRGYWETDYIVFGSTPDYAYWDGTKRGWRQGDTRNYKLGIDYTVGKGHVLGIMIDGNNSRRDRFTGINSNIYTGNRIAVDSSLHTNNATGGLVDQYAFNLNYKGSLDTGGRRTINVDLDFVPFRNRKSQDVSSHGAESATMPFFSINNQSLQDISIASGKIDYTQKLAKDWVFETGAKWSRIITNNELDFYNQEQIIRVRDSLRSNRFRYTERIAALYANVQGMIGKVYFQAGLRGEHTHTTGYSETLNQTQYNDYFKLFPTFFSSYALAEGHDVNLSYGMRISRPDYWRLNPFKYYTGPFTYMEGNPGLRPAYLHEAELGYTLKKTYSITYFYRNTQNYFSNITIQDNDLNLFYDTQRNLDQSLETGIYFSAPVSLFSWWELNSFVQASFKKEKSDFLGGQFNYQTWFVHANLSQAFVLSRKGGLKAEINTWYTSPSIQGLYRLAGNYDVSLGLRKTLWNGKGNIQVSVTDLFYSNYYRIDVNYLNQQNGFRERADTRSVILSFSYKLGGKKLEAARNRKTSAEEERKRAAN